MKPPLDGNNLPTGVGDRVIDKAELPEGGITNENDAFTETIVGELQLKRGTSRHFEVFCDEPARIGGTDKYPSPMTYLAMAVGF
jgi:hypothetical protein